MQHTYISTRWADAELGAFKVMCRGGGCAHLNKEKRSACIRAALSTAALSLESQRATLREGAGVACLNLWGRSSVRSTSFENDDAKGIDVNAYEEFLANHTTWRQIQEPLQP